METTFSNIIQYEMFSGLSVILVGTTFREIIYIYHLHLYLITW